MTAIGSDTTNASAPQKPLTPPEKPVRRRGRVSPPAQWAMVGGAVLIMVLVTLVAGHPVPGVLAGLVTLLIVTGAVSGMIEGARRARDRVFTIVVAFAFLLALVPLVTVTLQVIVNGATRFDLEFLTTDMRGVLGPGGGALHAIAGTLLITLAAAVISVPIGILCAIYLVEYGRGRLAKLITIFVDVMTGIPSIVAGLFAYTFFSLFFGPSIRFGFGGAVALSVLMIPVVVRSVEEMLKLVPNELREASYALGVSRWRTIMKVVLPTAGGGIAAGITIAIARVIGETAPLLIIAGSTKVLNENLFDGRMMTLPVFTYESYMIPGVPPSEGVDRAWAAALTLMIIVMGLNLIARLIARLLGKNAKTR
jgi:phosphate transport system permease protein